jgi:hypothetical protein
VPHASTAALLTIIEGDRPLPRTSAAYHHVVGLLDLTLKLRDAGCQVAWKHPETYLHPWHQANLGDVAISLTKDHQ